MLLPLRSVSPVGGSGDVVLGRIETNGRVVEASGVAKQRK
jgi:hypothetical protein